MPSAFEELKAKMHAIPGKASMPGSWRQRTQTDAEAIVSLEWAKAQLAEWEYLGDYESIAAVRLALRTRILDLERRLGVSQ